MAGFWYLRIDSIAAARRAIGRKRALENREAEGATCANAGETEERAALQAPTGKYTNAAFWRGYNNALLVIEK